MLAEEAVELGCVGQLDHEQPAVTVRILVDLLRRVAKPLVHLDDGARHGRIDLRHRLRRLDLAAARRREHVESDVGQLHVHDVTECVLRVVGDPDPRTTVLDTDPLVLARVAKVLGKLHRPSLLVPATNEAARDRS